MKHTERDIMIFMELQDGELKNSSLELFTAAESVAAHTGGQIIAVVIGGEVSRAVQNLQAYHPDVILKVSSPELAVYSTASYVDTLHSLILKYQPDAVMVSATKNGKDLAPRLARRLNTGITANCVELSVEADTGLISWNMPAPGGIMATILCSDSRPQMGTICPGAFSRPAPKEPVDTCIIEENAVSAAKAGLRFISQIKNEKDNELSVDVADIIVAGGRGMGSQENFALIHELAELLGAAVGASRTVVDAEWIDQKHLLGQTGKIVHPKLYIACGISGALQHMVGVENADCIVAINRDPDAPIFNYADYAIVGDVKQIIPAIIDALKK